MGRVHGHHYRGVFARNAPLRPLGAPRAREDSTLAPQVASFDGLSATAPAVPSPHPEKANPGSRGSSSPLGHVEATNGRNAQTPRLDREGLVSVHPGFQDLDVLDGVRFNFAGIFVEDHHVGEFADFKAADFMLGE